MMFRAGAAASLVLAVSATQTTEEGLFDDACRSLEAQDGASCSMALLQLRMRKTRRKVSQDQDFIVAAVSEDDPDHWSYSDTSLWETSFASCGGHMQSPIDIDKSKVDLAEKAQAGTTISQFASYAPVGPDAALKMKNTGHSVQLNGAFGVLSLPDGEYEAKQIQFHFPSEHTVDGIASAGEMHIIHQRKGATGTDGLAIVAILLRTAMPGSTDSQMQKELDFFTSLGFGKRLPGQGAEIQLPENAAVDLQAAFGPQLAGTFFHYQGSLTAPPCSEDVHWYVLQEPAYATRAMVNNFKSLFPSPANSRPTQPLHDRLLVISEVETGLDEFSSHHQSSSDEMVLEVEEVEEEHEEDDVKSQAQDKNARKADCQGIEVLSVDHEDGPNGKYFNFDKSGAEVVLGHVMDGAEEFRVTCDRTGETNDVRVWSNANGGSIGDAHGRKTPKAAAAKGDWEVGDCLTVVYQAAAELPSWSYSHSGQWEEDFPACGGDAQSPVNIDTDDVDSGTGTGPKIAELASYTAVSGLSLSNNGKVMTLEGASFGILRLPDGDYAAKQLEFHFPSEHTIDGIPKAGEVQIVHQKIGSNSTDDMAMVSIMLEEAQAAAQLELGFFESLGFGTRLPMDDDSIALDPGMAVNLGETFRAQLQGSFYHYAGSLTAPPCSETAHWYIMQAPAPVTRAMINNFKSLFPDPANARPVQKLKGRSVVDSKIQVDDAEFDLEDMANTRERGWGYTNADSWVDNFPECGGENQSPVNINTDKAGDTVGTGAKLAELVRYSAAGPFAFLKTSNTGRALQVSADFGVLMLPDGDYTAKQVQFHFPSEHTIDGENAAGELQIVHQRTDAEGTDGLAVISILLEVATPGAQPELGFFDSLGLGKGSLPSAGEDLELPAQQQINLGAAFGAQLNQPYYHYRGSLTSPPCSETVHWYVLQQTAAVTQEMVDEAKALFRDERNNRPVQKLNGRKIGISEIETDPEEFESESSEQGWTYKRPEKWEDEFPSCAGTSQSPINIMTATASPGSGAVLSQSATFETVGPYAWLKLFNNGHSLQMDADFGILTLPDGDYEAKQLHFHFPSEHQIDGVLAAGEMHIVCQRKGATGTDGLAVIAVLLHDTDQVDPKVLSFLTALGFSGRLPTKDAELELPVGLELNLGEVFTPQLNGEFYHYEGSLTTPPCSESVHWYVLQMPAGVGRAMVNNFKSLFPPPANNRPVQPLNGRAVIVSELATSASEFGDPVAVQVEEPEEESSKKSKKSHWSYSKPSDWEEDYEECGGESQSPIDIDTLDASKYRGESTLSDLIKYATLGPNANLRVDNDGHAIKMEGAFGVLTLPDGEYEAKQLHFHFPSEHSVDGVLAAGEMHIVHQLRGATGTEGLAVIGVLLHEAELLAKTGDLEQTLGFFESLGFGKKLPVEGWQLPLPQDFVVDLGTTFAEQLSGNFFHYEGSLTTPPCSETVHWYMLERPAPITQAMVNNFKAQFPDPMNNRPVQSLNKRKVVVNDIETGKKEFGRVLPVEGEIERGVWTYDDTEQWSDAYPDCAGDAQSPIDIDTFKADDFKGNQPLEDRIHYSALGPNAGLQVLNNGHAIKIAGNFGTLDLPDGSYAVRQLHFHFPSEHSIDGVLAAGEMQIVHQRVGAQGTDGIAIVSVLLHDAEMLQVDGEGKELGFFSDLGFGAVLPQEKQLMDLPAETVIDLGGVFSSQLAGSYYHYGGSLTRPPCTESVHWYILEQPAPISKSMVNNFKELFPSPMNNRPIQPINERDIWINKIKTDKCEFGWCPPEEDNKSSKKGKSDEKKSDKKSDKKDEKSDKKDKKSDKKDKKSDKKEKKSNKKDEAPWTYTSVQKWEDDFPKCGGNMQSPIDVQTDSLSSVQGAGAALNTMFTYGAVGPNAGFEFANDGHSMVLKGNWGTLRLPDGDYIANSLNFHFPSEHAVDGVLFPGEMQIVHQRSDAKGTNDLAVISIFLRDADMMGQEGPVGFFNRLGFSSRLPVEGETIMLGADTVLDIGAIFAPQFAGAYYHYQGSLTTPPCSETVHWYLMQTAAGINKAMVNNFKSLFPSPANNRPIQALKGRAVVTSELAVGADEFS
jgi:carbonic anhydrase